MYCRVCGTKINDDSAFCYSCGNKVENIATPQPQVQYQPQPQIQVQPQVQPQVNAPQTNYNYAATNQQNYNGYNQINPQNTDYSYVTGTVGANQQNYNGYNQVNYELIPVVPQDKVDKLENKIFVLGLISVIIAETGAGSIVGIILGALAGKNAKRLKRLGCPIKGKAKAGEILGKVGLILSIVMTVFWVLYFGMMLLALLGVYTMEGGGGFNI